MAEHGGNIYNKKNLKIDFSANINPFGISENVRKALYNSVDNINCYPDPLCTDIRRKAADFHGTEPENIVFGNGGADIIFRLVNAVKPHKVVVPVPSFAEYHEALSQSGCEIVNYFINHDNFRINYDILDMLKSDIDMIILCIPNNPTGQLTDENLLFEIIHKAYENNILVFADECFIDMTDNPQKYSVFKYIRKYSNIFILKSMTKMYAVPGLRLGYGISSDKELVEKTRKSGQPWPVNSMAAAAGAAMFDDSEYRNRFISYLADEREFMYNELKKTGLEVFRPSADYIFFHSGNNTYIYEKLLEKGIMIRDCSDYTGLSEGYYRIAVKKHDENKILLEALKEIL